MSNCSSIIFTAIVSSILTAHTHLCIHGYQAISFLWSTQPCRCTFLSSNVLTFKPLQIVNCHNSNNSKKFNLLQHLFPLLGYNFHNLGAFFDVSKRCNIDVELIPFETKSEILACKTTCHGIQWFYNQPNSKLYML